MDGVIYMRNVRKSLICMFTCILLSVFLLPATPSFKSYAESELSSVTVTKGTYKGFEQLKGYPEEKKYAVYFKATKTSSGAESLQLSVVNLNYNPNKIIKWKYKGRTYQNKLKDCYKFFSDSTYLESKLKISGTYISQEWLSYTFGKAYDDWFAFEAFSSDAEFMVNDYLYGDVLEDRFADTEISKDDMWLSEDYLSQDNLIFIDLQDGTGPSFRFYSSLSGSVGKVIYEVPDFKPDFKGAQTFSKIRMQYINGKLHFNNQDLLTLGIIK